MFRGVRLTAWLEMYDNWKRGNGWPDGGAYLQQPCVTVRVFQIVDHQIEKERAKDVKRN